MNADANSSFLFSNRHLTHPVSGFVDSHNDTRVHKTLEFIFDNLFARFRQGACTMDYSSGTFNQCQVNLFSR